jgi:hypothetical protein
MVRTLASTTPSVVSTAADEMADVGGPQSSVTVHAAQLSATVGRSGIAQATLAV